MSGEGEECVGWVASVQCGCVQCRVCTVWDMYSMGCIQIRSRDP